MTEKQEALKPIPLNDEWTFYHSLRGRKAKFSSNQYDSNLNYLGFKKIAIIKFFFRRHLNNARLLQLLLFHPTPRRLAN